MSIYSAELVSYTQINRDFCDENMNLREIIAFCARVSNPENQMNKKTSDKLIKYLIENKHWSPFEMVNVCLAITATRDIARQILRHRSFSFQEFSQRYADPVDELNFVIREARLQDDKNRQNSIELGALHESLGREWKTKQETLIEHAKNAYIWAINNGIAKEQARVVLPEGNTLSKLYVNGTIRSWIHYIELRSSNGTQKEHIELARACAVAIDKIFPIE